MAINIDEVKEFIKSQSSMTKIYFGADSERIRIDDKKYVDYMLVIAVHFEGKHGAKIFGEIHREEDYDKNLSRPKLRLMNEVYKISELYLQVADCLEDKDVSIHLDLNPSAIHGSNCAVQEAMGYVRGVCSIDPVIKPNAWCASTAADALKRIMHQS